VQFW
jgi:hypothetical protein